MTEWKKRPVGKRNVGKEVGKYVTGCVIFAPICHKLHDFRSSLKEEFTQPRTTSFEHLCTKKKELKDLHRRVLVGVGDMGLFGRRWDVLRLGGLAAVLVLRHDVVLHHGQLLGLRDRLGRRRFGTSRLWEHTFMTSLREGPQIAGEVREVACILW